MSFNLNVQLAPVNFNNPAQSRLQNLTLRHLTDISAVAVTVGEGASVTGSAGSEMIVASEQTHLREHRAPSGATTRGRLLRNTTQKYSPVHLGGSEGIKKWFLRRRSRHDPSGAP